MIFLTAIPVEAARQATTLPGTTRVAPAQKPAQAPTQQENPADEAAKEVQEVRSEMNKVYEMLNSLNPFSDQMAKPATPNAAADQNLGYANELQKIQEKINQLQAILNHPVTKKYIGVMTNPSFKQGIQEMKDHPNAKTFLLIELGFIIFSFFLRSWLIAKQPFWFRRFLVSMSSLAVVWVIMLAVIPFAVFGPSFTKMALGIYQGMMTV